MLRFATLAMLAAALTACSDESESSAKAQPATETAAIADGPEERETYEGYADVLTAEQESALVAEQTERLREIRASIESGEPRAAYEEEIRSIHGRYGSASAVDVLARQLMPLN